MKISQENIYRLLESAAERGLTVKEMLINMDQKKKRKAVVRKALSTLTKKKACYKRDNRYYLLDQPAKASRSIQKSAPVSLSKSNRSRKRRKNEFIGIVICRNRSATLYSFDHQSEFNIVKSNIRDYLHGDLVRFSVSSENVEEKSASLLEIIDRKITQLKGNLHIGKKGKLVFKPNGEYVLREFNVTNSLTIKNEGEPAWLEITSFSKDKKHPEGKARLIKEDDIYQNPVLENILIANKIPTRFPEKVLDASSLLSKDVRLNKNSARVDLRNLPFVTIDGEDAKDFDDAIYAVKEGEKYKIWVSIADVDQYVPQGSAIDKEAFCRGTSTYIPGKVFPMLPESLSNGVCSLKEGVNRNTLTCEMVVDKKGNTHSTKIYTSINKIACRLTYTAVDHYYATNWIKQRKSFQSLSAHLDLYREIMNILRKMRISKGFINFQLPETKFDYDKKNRITDISKVYQTEAMQVIEQFMLLANENVAQYCERHRIPIVWRNHPQPLPEKRKQLQNLLWNSNIKVTAMNSGKDYNVALDLVKNSPEKDYLEYSVLRSMSLAVYEIERKGHFGLSATHYCHFTSPIRRFPDLLVHRALKCYLKGKKPPVIPEYMAATSSGRERLATVAERSCSKFFKLDFMSDRIGDLFEVKITGFVHSGIFVEVDSPYVEGFVPLKTIFDDRYEYDEENQCIRGRKNRLKFKIGDRLKVMLTNLDIRNLSSEFNWICWQE
ncbi:VacB/RNase II family 3'-5' exoribonuclease [bacterium]|nr:VacB/RNase II family 3'-5' exoribonuclease [bacterium]